MADATLVPADLGQDPNLIPADLGQPSAQDNVIHGSFGNADAAGKAFTLAPKVMTPATVVNGNYESFEQDKNRADGLKAVESKSLLQRFAEKSALHAEVAQDDWSNATQMANQVDWLKKEGHEKKVDAALYASSPEGRVEGEYLSKLRSPFSSRVEQIKKQGEKNSDAFWSAFSDKSRVDQGLDELEKSGIIDHGTRYMWELSMIPTAGRAIEGLLSGGVGAIKALGSEFAGRAIDSGAEELMRTAAEKVFTETGGSGLDNLTGPKKFEQGVQQVIDAELARSMAEHVPTITRGQVVDRFLGQANKWLTDPKAGELVPRTQGFEEAPGKSVIRDDITEFLRQRTTGQFDPTKFKSPDMKAEVTRLAGEKPVGEPVKPADSMEVVKAEVAAETLNDTIEVAKESKILKRSPEVFEHMINAEGEAGFVYVDAKAILEMYKGAKKTPAVGDGLLGDVPDLMGKAAEAAIAGGEVAIPLSKYIIAAAQNPAVHTSLAEFIRLHDTGTTLAEAAVLKKQEPHSEIHHDVIAHLNTLQPEAFERVHKAALRYGDKVFTGQNHAEAMEVAKEAGHEGTAPEFKPPVPREEGFTTTHGRFVSREEAYKIADRQGQIKPEAKAEELEPQFPDEARGVLAQELLLEPGEAVSLVQRELMAEEAVKAAKEEAAKKEALTGEEAEAEAPAGSLEAKEEQDLSPQKQETKARPGANTKRLAQLLGPKLYGDPTDMDEVSVKEMLQNSFDALKSLIEKGQVKNPRIDLQMDEKKRTITITDNGSGMTADTLGGPFLRIADSMKETESSSGGFGIAKMLFLFGNKELRVVTMRDGKISTMITTGEQLFNALEDPDSAPSITTVPSIMYGKGRGESWKDIFPEGHGTRVEIVLPDSFKDPSTGEQKAIQFRTGTGYGQHNAVVKSPLFRDIEVNWSRYKGDNKPLPIGKNFPYDKYTQFANVNFDWGKAHIYITKEDIEDHWSANVHVLSNGIYQFSLNLPKDPQQPYGKVLPRELYIDVDSKAKPTDAGYPFDLNRQGLTKSAGEDLKKILSYIGKLHQQVDIATSVKNFGDVQYYSPDGKGGERVRLEPKLPPSENAVTALDENDKIQVKDGKLIVSGRVIPELTPDQLKASRINVDELKMDQGDIDPDRVMLHDNIEIWDDGVSDYVSLVDAGRAKFGDRFDAYVHGIGDKFKTLRDVVAAMMNYPDLRKEGIGVSFDKEYRGVSVVVPFNGMFLNPAVPRYTDPVRAAVGMVGTMIHEFAHHKVRSHDAEFPAEMQDIIIALDALEHLESNRITLDKPYFSLMKFKEETIKLVKDHEDVLQWLNGKLLSDQFQQVPFGQNEPSQPLVRNRGKRFKDAGSRQATDAGVSGNTEKTGETVQGGYESLRPALQELGDSGRPGDVAKGDRGGKPGPLTEASKEVTKTPGAAQAVVGIKRERRSLYLDPILTRGKTLNIDQSMYKRLSDLVERSQLHILERAIDIARGRVKKELSAEWKAEEAKLYPKVQRDLLKTPTWAADRYFNWEKGVLPGGKKLVAKDMTTLGTEGVESFADFFGFKTGSEMVGAVLKQEGERTDHKLSAKKQLDLHVKDEVRRRMEEKYGSLNDNIAIASSEEALASWNLDLLDQELKMLAEAHGVAPPLTREQLTDWQKENFGREVASEVSYEKRRRETERNGKKVEKSLLKEDPAEALLNMQGRIKSYLLAREAKAFEKERAKAERLFGKYASDANLPQVDQEYTDHIQKLLKTVGAKVARTIENIDYNLAQGTTDTSQFIAGKVQQGRMIVDAPLPVDDNGGIKKLEDFTVNEFRDFTTMIKTLDHNGRFEKMVEVRGKREEFREVIDKIAKALDRMEKKNFDPQKTDVVSEVRRLGRYIDSKLLKAENLLSWIDSNDPHGIFTSVVIRPLIEAEHAKGDMLTKLSALARKIPGDMKWSHSLNDPVLTNPNWSLRDEMGEVIQHTNEQKLAIALNYGNKGNRDVLTRAHGWTEGEVEAFLANSMSATDWSVVNAIHDLFKPLAPLVEAATRERSGVAIPLVDATPFLGSNGGYFPLVRDPRDVLIKVKQDVDLFDKTKFDPLPMAPALKQRTGKVYKLDLSLNSLNGILSQTTHAVTMQSPVVNANKVLKDPFVREGIAKAFGPEYVRMLDDWIKDIANNGGEHDSSTASWISRNMRQNVVTTLMGYKVSTALIHGGSAGVSSVYELGKLHMDEKGAMAFAAAPIELARNIGKLKAGNLPEIARRFFNSNRFVEMYNEAQSQSGELRNRQRTAQNNLEFGLGKVLRKNYLDEAGYWKAMYQTYSMAMVGYIDLLTATPVWLAVRDAELKKGTDLEDAIFIADKAVREAHGSASLVSRANVGRGEMNKWFTIAYNGYWNHNYNKYRSEYHVLAEKPEDTRTGGREEHDFEGDARVADEALSIGTKVAMGAAFLTAFIIAPSIIHHEVRGKEETTLAGSIAAMGASQLLGTVPVLGGLAFSVIHNRDPSVSPLDTVLKSATDVWRDIVAKRPTKHPISHAFKAASYFTGYGPTNQFTDTASFMYEAFNGKRIETPGQWARGVFALGDKGKKP